MKTFSIKTIVNCSMAEVWNKFDVDLFNALQPSFPKTKVYRFDGCKTGDEVHTELNIVGLKQIFNARIVENKESENECYFIDEGTKLPFFLKSWRHKHIITKWDENSSVITDEITFSSPNKLLEAFFYPAIYGQLYLRKPIYRRYFCGE